MYNKDKPGRYKVHVHSNSFFDFKKHDSCKMHFHSTFYRDVAKNHKKKTWVKKTSMSTGSETKKREPLSRPRDKEIMLKVKRRNYCNHCEMSGHWIGKCWKVHPQICPKRGKRVVQALAKKKEADEGVSPVTIIPEADLQKDQLSKEHLFEWLSKQWLSFLRN
jgi:hypothetical protein